MKQLSTENYTITISKYCDVIYVDIEKTEELTRTILDNIMLGK